jgi:hypothetical protein
MVMTTMIVMVAIMVAIVRKSAQAAVSMYQQVVLNVRSEQV